MLQRFREFVTPAARSKISAAVYRSEAHRWKGRRGGIAMSFTLSAQPDLEGRRIVWTAEIRGAKIQGVSGTVYEAIDQIERKAGYGN
jgi:hypothetical protein